MHVIHVITSQASLLNGNNLISLKSKLVRSVAAGTGTADRVVCSRVRKQPPISPAAGRFTFFFTEENKVRSNVFLITAVRNLCMARSTVSM